jgi:hypothetical protein
VRRRAVSAIIAVVLAAGAVALALRPPAVDVPPVRDKLAARLREAAAGLHARVATLAELPRLAAAVSTDAETVRDLTQDELAFRPRPGEVIAVGQLPRGGRPVALLVLPDSAEPPPLDGTGTRARVSGTTLWLSEMIEVTPRDRADELQGAVAASWPVAVADLAPSLAGPGWLEAPGGRLTLREGGVRARHELPIADGVRLVVDTPARVGWGLPVSLGVGALAFVALALRRRRPLVALPAAPASFTRQIGRYEILRRLGDGGVAEVYLARARGEAGFEKLVALKVLQQSLARQPMVVDNFLDEARLAARLNHPNVVQILELGRADDEYFIAMEYVEGADLARLIETSRRHGEHVSLGVALMILRRICDGLHAAHTATAADGQALRLVHRDVKSANVFVARNGSVKVGDFGIATASQTARVSRTEIGLLKGTPGYMAPEHRMGHPVDARADLYGVGAIAYELLAGTPVNLDLAMLVHRGREGWPHLAPLSSVRSDIPPDLEATILKALAYERDDRHPDCAALEHALEAIARRYAPGATEKLVAQWIESTLALEVEAPAYSMMMK